MIFGLRDLNREVMAEAVTEKPVCPGLVASFLVLSGESESPCGKLPGILHGRPGERPRSVEQRRSRRPNIVCMEATCSTACSSGNAAVRAPE